MPKKFHELGLSLLYPDNWSLSQDESSQAVTVESPEGAFFSVTRLEGSDLETPLQHAKDAMETEYENVENEPLDKQIADRRMLGITQRFVYLDLIVTSHLLSFLGPDCTYLVQIQAEDRDMTRLEQVFDAMLTSIVQSESN